MPMTITQIEVSNIRSGRFMDNSRTPSHNIACISYTDDRQRLNAITPEVIAETYGIPRDGAILQYGPAQRLFSIYRSATSSRSTRTISTTQR